MFHKIKSVTPLDPYILLIHFANGSAKMYDVKPLFDRIEAFNDLRNIVGLWEMVQVDVGGYGVYWNDQIDIACDELWHHGKPVSTPFDHLISLSDATQLWGLNESTLRKAISYGKLKDGVDVKKFGKQWIVTLDAMKREYGNPMKQP